MRIQLIGPPKPEWHIVTICPGFVIEVNCNGGGYLLTKLEDQNSFLSRLGLIVVGSLVVIGLVYFGTIAWKLMAPALIGA